jgi:O-antigen/teichoic acid export membrane protein
MSEPTPSPRGDRRTRTAVGSLHARDRSLIASAGAAVMARVISALATLVSIGLAARSLSIAELGVVSVLSALLIYFNFGDFGTGAVVMSRLPPAHARGDVDAMRLVVSSALSAMVIIATVLAAIGIASIWLFPWRQLLGAESIPWPELRNALLALVITGTVGIVGTVGSRILAALQRGALIRVCDSIAAVASMIAVAFCAAFDAPIWVFLLALFAPLTSTWVLQLGYVMVRYPDMRIGPKDLDPVVGVRFLRDGLAFAVLSMGWAIAYTLDAVVVAAVLGAAQAAIFSIAARLFHIVSGTLTLAGQQMWPAMAEAIARGDVSWVQRRFRHSILTAAGVATFCSVVLVVIGPTLARLWVGEALVPPLSLFLALGAWTIYITFIVQYSHMLMVAERVRLLAGLGVVLAAVNLGASIILTQHIGLIGPVVGNLVAAFLVQLVPMIMLTRRFMREISLRSAPATS